MKEGDRDEKGSDRGKAYFARMLPGTAMLTVHFRPELGLKIAVGLEVSMFVELCSMLESCFRYVSCEYLWLCSKQKCAPSCPF